MVSILALPRGGFFEIDIKFGMDNLFRERASINRMPNLVAPPNHIIINYMKKSTLSSR